MMVLTPTHTPIDLPSSFSPHSAGSYFSVDSHASGPSQPRLRKTSTGSFSKLSDFQLEAPLLEEKDRYAPESTDTNGVAGVKHTALSVDAGEWRHPVFKMKVMGILRHLVGQVGHTPLTPSAYPFGRRRSSRRHQYTFRRSPALLPTLSSLSHSIQLRLPHRL